MDFSLNHKAHKTDNFLRDDKTIAPKNSFSVLQNQSKNQGNSHFQLSDIDYAILLSKGLSALFNLMYKEKL